MLELKYSAVPFGKMYEDELMLAASKMILTINIITGWEVYEDEGMQNQLRWQLKNKMVESYPNCNSQEVEYAFRNNTTVKDWGKFMNLSLIDEVMIPYLEKRFELSAMELSKDRPELPASVEQVSDEEIIQVAKDIWNATKNYMYISTKAYDVLYNSGKLKVSDQDRARIKAVVKVKLDTMLLEHSDLFRDIPREKMEVRICKKIAVSEFFNLK